MAELQRRSPSASAIDVADSQCPPAIARRMLSGTTKFERARLRMTHPCHDLLGRRVADGQEQFRWLWLRGALVFGQHSVAQSLPSIPLPSTGGSVLPSRKSTETQILFARPCRI